MYAIIFVARRHAGRQDTSSATALTLAFHASGQQHSVRNFSEKNREPCTRQSSHKITVCIDRCSDAYARHRFASDVGKMPVKRTNLPVKRLSLNRSQYRSCSARYDTSTES